MPILELNGDFPARQVVSAASLSVRLPFDTAQDKPRPPRRYFRHGWHSWSLAAWTDPSPLPIQKPYILHPMQVDPVYAREPRPHGSWLGAVGFEDGGVALLGSLGLEAHVSLSESRLEGRYESGEGDWFLARGDETAVFSEYAAELGKRFGPKTNKPAPRIWSSWYSLYAAIDESLLHKTFEGLGDLPFDVLQVDDGWQLKVGDWQANPKFPSGMAALADKIRATGRKAGLWLAPLIAVRSSRLFHEHPDWFLRDEGRRLVSAGHNWGEQLHALDTTQPAVRAWLAALMRQVRAWGFDFLKLDFLYGGGLPGKRHREVRREAAYRGSLELLRDAMGADAYFLACGAPIVASLGLCDALRAGPDVAGAWEDRRDAVLLYNPTIPGARNAIRTTVNRLWIEPLVQVDPDVAFFASKGNSLTGEQKRLLQDLALICNFKATSDLPQWLTAEERQGLQAFLESEPKIEQIAPREFRVDDRTVNFEPVMALPEPPNGLDALQGAVTGWLGSQGWALTLLDKLQKNALEEMKRRL
jgi:alpha-galactosidase